MENKRKALGKGLEQLFSNERIDFENFEQTIVEEAKQNDIVEIPLVNIRSNTCCEVVKCDVLFDKFNEAKKKRKEYERMIKQAEKGFLFRSPEHIQKDNPDVKAFTEYDELFAAIKAQVESEK